MIWRRILTQLRNSKKITVRQLALDSLLVATAMIFSYVEAIIPLPIGIPGVKLGLANLVIISAIYMISPVEVFGILLVRILLSGFLFGNLAGIVYSFAGGILSYICMLIMKRTGWFSIFGTSIAGGVCHNIGQMLVAVIIVANINLLMILPVLLISGAIAGAIIGLIGARTSKLLKHIDNWRE